MSRLDVTCLLKRHLRGSGALLGLERLEQEADMIAEIHLFDNRTREPALAVIKDRHTMCVVPAYPGELVYDIASFSAKELRDVLVPVLDDMYGNYGRLARKRKRMVFLRDAGEKARRMNTALRGKADQAAGWFVLHGCRDHV